MAEFLIMSCTPPRNSRNPTARAFPSRPGVRNVIYPPRRNNPNGRLAHLRPNNAAVCTGSRAIGGERVFEPLSLNYASLAGSGSLVGFTGFEPTTDGVPFAPHDPAAPWNAGPVRKWTRKTLAGTLSDYGTFINGLGTPRSVRWVAAYVGTVDIDAGGMVRPTAATRTYQEAEEDVYASLPAYGAPVVSPDQVGVTISGSNHAVETTLTRLRVYGLGSRSVANPDYPGSPTILSTEGETTETLSSPDTEYAALVRSGGAVAGALAETSPAVWATIPAGSYDPLPFTGAVAVRASADFSGIVPGLSYELRAVYRARPLGGGMSYTFGASAPVSVSAWRETLAHDLPLVPLHAVSLVSLHLVAL